MTKPLVAIVMGSDSDLPIMQGAAKMLDKFDIPYEAVIFSAHRVPEQTAEYARMAHQSGIKVIIAGAGMAAHLPGVIAAFTPLPVIGVPIKSGALEGVDALYAMVQMPSGIPVATVAINGAKNAGVLAAQILSTADEGLQNKIIQYKQELAQEVEKKNSKLRNMGIEGYLAVKK